MTVSYFHDHKLETEKIKSFLEEEIPSESEGLDI